MRCFIEAGRGGRESPRFRLGRMSLYLLCKMHTIHVSSMNGIITTIDYIGT